MGSNDEIRLIVIGRTGEGISTLANNILGEKFFKTDDSQASVTVKSAFSRSTVYGRRLLVIDTPGFSHTDITDKEDFKKELMTALRMTLPGPHAFVCTIQIGRRYGEHLGLFKTIESIFGSDMLKYLMVVFAVNKLTIDKMTIEENAESLRNWLKYELKRDIRVVVVDSINNECQDIHSFFLCLVKQIKERKSLDNADLHFTITYLRKFQILFSFVSGSKICSVPFIFVYIMCALGLCVYFIYKIYCTYRN